MYILHVVCSYCGVKYDSKVTNLKTEDGLNVSHGICPECLKE